MSAESTTNPSDEVPQVNDNAQESGIDDAFSFDLPDIPLPEPEAVVQTVNDSFNAAVKFSFIGSGQGGGRLVSEFYKLGYKRTCAINTSIQDLNGTELMENQKLFIGVGGTGKNRRIGEAQVKQHSEEVMELMRRSFGPQFDRIMVVASVGGGTGSGSFETIVKLSNELVESLRLKKVGDPTRVGLMLVLPSDSERDRMSNAVEAIRTAESLLAAGLVSPLVIVDNERIGSMYPSATVGNVWSKANQSIVTLWHLFNLLAGAPTKHVTFDVEEYRSILSSGIVIYGAMQITDVTKDGMSKAIRENLKKTVLCGGLDIATAKSAACVICGESSSLEAIPWEVIEHSYEMLGRVAGGAVVHRGIYAAKRPLSAYTILGGLSLPKPRLDEIARLAGRRDWDE